MQSKVTIFLFGWLEGLPSQVNPANSRLMVPPTNLRWRGMISTLISTEIQLYLGWIQPQMNELPHLHLDKCSWLREKLNTQEKKMDFPRKIWISWERTKWISQEEEKFQKKRKNSPPPKKKNLKKIFWQLWQFWQLKLFVTTLTILDTCDFWGTDYNSSL